MEADQNPFPDFKLFHPIEALKKAGRFLLYQFIHDEGQEG